MTSQAYQTGDAARSAQGRDRARAYHIVNNNKVQLIPYFLHQKVQLIPYFLHQKVQLIVNCYYRKSAINC